MEKKIRRSKVKVLWLLFGVMLLSLVSAFNHQIVEAETLSPPNIISPNEPEWDLLATDVSTSKELQKIIDGVGTKPTKIQLKKDILRHDNTGVTGFSVLKVAAGQKIMLTSEAEKITLDVTFAEDTTRGALFVEEKATLYLENIRVTGGNRVEANGGGGAVLIGLGKGSPGEGLFVMKDGAELIDNKAGFGAGVYVSPFSQFYMLGGKITNNDANVRGGGVYVYQGGEFYLTQGEISANFGGSQGGNAVYVDGNAADKSVFLMSGGLITKNGRPTKVGGGVYLNHGIFNMMGGEISHHIGNGRGGGVAVTDSLFNLWDGQIKNNSNYYGGAVTVVGSMREADFESANVSLFNMYGGLIGGESEEEANTGAYPAVMVGNAGWNNQGGTFNMYGGKISANVSTGDKKHGGGLFVTNYGQANILGNAEISHNRLNENGLGGGIGVFSGRLLVDDQARIIDNTAGHGGGIFASDAEVIFNQGTLSHNTAVNGGGIYLASQANFYLKNGTISQNLSKEDGGGIYLVERANLYLEGGSLEKDRATVNGGAIFNRSSPNFKNLYLPESAEVTFTQNQAAKAQLSGTLPTTGDWSGSIKSTSIDGMEFSGKIKSKIDDFLAKGGKLKKLLVFNNHDINMTATDYFYTVDFESNGGSQIPTQLVSDGGSGVVEEPTQPERIGYRFVGWFRDENLTNLYDFKEFVLADMTLYAKWNPIVEGVVLTKYVNQDGKEIAARNQTTGEVGTGYITEEKTIPGYTILTFPENALGSYAEGTIEVTYVYSKKKDLEPVLEGTIITKYVDEDGKEIAARNQMTGEVGTEYITEEKSISGYMLQTVPANTTGIYTEGTIEVTYVYSKKKDLDPVLEGTVITKYVDEDGKEIAARNQMTGEVGTEYITEEKSISGYTILTVPENATGIYTEGTIEVTYVYSKKKDLEPVLEGTVITKYVDEDGKEIAARNQMTGEVGTEYITEKKSISGYTILTFPENATGHYTEGTIEVNYIYSKTRDLQPEVRGTVITKYLDEAGAEISERHETTGEVGTEYTTEEKTISGFTIKTVPENGTGHYGEGTIEVVYVYSRNRKLKSVIEGNIVTKYVDESGNEIAGSNQTTGEVGTAYTTKEKSIFGYTIKTVPTNATGNYEEGSLEVIYVYRKNVVAKDNNSDKPIPQQKGPNSINPINKKDQLPQTGENKPLSLILVGVFMLIVFSFILKRRIKLIK